MIEDGESSAFRSTVAQPGQVISQAQLSLDRYHDCATTHVITIEPVTQRDAMLLKHIRLRALRDAPSAFSSTYEKESVLNDADWAERTAQWSGERSITYLAKDAGAPCGIAAAYFDHENPEMAHLVSMWVAPTYRRLGIGEMLVDKIFDWVQLKNAATLTLLVTSSNDAAIKFYERLGFAMTGKTTPHANDPSLGDCEMSWRIA
jgi:ribosomal protein S18 acetylase RimI-like enzyme